MMLSLLSTFAITSSLLWFYLSGPPIFVESAGKIDPADLKKWVEKFGENVTYNQILEWFKSQQGDDEDVTQYPRLFPICVTAEQAKSWTSATEHLRSFSQILADMEKDPKRFYEFDDYKDSFHNNTAWIKNLTVDRIITPEPDMVNLRQWLHIHITTTVPLKGLYMQSVVGPLGLPFGEFSVEFPCADYPYTVGTIDVIGQVSHCAYRPRASIHHPDVYVAKTKTATKDFHVHFLWSDITCMETPYLQFILIAVKSFTPNPEAEIDYKPILSPVFLNTDFDSRDGAPYPYYPGWEDGMYCNIQDGGPEFRKVHPKLSIKIGADAKFSGLHWGRSNDTFRIQPNEVYDACVTGELTDDRDDARLECPPGPFQCDESYATLDKDEGVQKKREDLVKEEEATTKCYPCKAPRCSADIGFPPEKCNDTVETAKETINDIKYIDSLQTTSAQSSHGAMASLAFLVLIPVANVLGRFYKDVWSEFLCGNGPWIFAHIGLHIVSVVIMWISIGPVAPALAEYQQVLRQCFVLYGNASDDALDCAYKQSPRNPHTIIGIIAFILQNLVCLFSFFRSTHAFIRFLQVFLHSHIGFLAWVLGSISALVSTFENPCEDSVIITILLFLLPLIASLANFFIDKATDRRLNIRPKRKQWPVLEPVKIDGDAPFTLVKWIVLGCFVGLMVLLWLLFTISSTMKSRSGRDAIEEALNVTDLSSLRPSGLFGECSGKHQSIF